MISSLTSKIKRPYFYCLVASIVLILSLPVILNWVINTGVVKNKLSAVIYQKTGMKVDAQKISFKIFPHTSLFIHQFDFYPDNRVKINLDSVQFTIDPGQLLRGRLEIRDIRVDRPRISTRTRAQTTPSLEPFDFSVLAYVQAIKDATAFLPGHQDSIEITIKNATSPYFRQMDGHLLLSKKENKTRLSTTAKGIRIGALELSTLGLESDLDLDSIAIDEIKTNIT